MAEHDLTIEPPEPVEVGGTEEPLDLWDTSSAPPPLAAGIDDPYEVPALVVVDDAQVRTVLEFAAELANTQADPDVPDQWLFEPGELDLLVPPLTRIVNRHQVLARLIAGSDPMLAAALFGKYLLRNLRDGATAARAREGEDPTHGDLDAEAGGPGPRPDRPGNPSDDRRPGDGWAAGVPAHEVDGVGAFQG